MERLNYHHLLYFWSVVREGGVSRAAEKLRLTPQTLSTQVKALESALGEKLLRPLGRGVVATEAGQLVVKYADEIFALGRELRDALRDRQPAKLLVGVVDVLPKLLVRKLLDPVFGMEPRMRIVCEEERLERLVGALAVHELDLMLSDAPVPAHYKVRVYNHLLGECGVVLMAAPKLAASLRSNFPDSLDGAPFLLPTETTPLRRDLDHWLEESGVRVNIACEFADSALAKVFGQAGRGVLAVPKVIEKEVRGQHGIVRVGEPEGICMRFYAVTVERRVRHPAVAAIARTARTDLFP